jgi:cytochrome b subunit of formate dehydrogenase
MNNYRRYNHVCQYACILHVPEDVKPDWLAAARKALDWAKSDAVIKTEEDIEWLKKAEKIVSQREQEQIET